MRIEFYRPNSQNTGCGISFQFVPSIGNQKDPSVILHLIQQFSWDAKKKIGNFSGNRENVNATARVKLNTSEIGEILSILDVSPSLLSFGGVNFSTFQTFHKTPENSTSITFYPKKETKKIFKDGQNQIEADISYSLSVMQNKTKRFSILLSRGDGHALKEFLQLSLMNSFGPVYEQQAQT